ncbi:MAG: hypothetical protein AAF557_26790 [Pseudomonadota bacterium]
MPLDAEAQGELKSLIGVSRKRDLNFGLCLAGKPVDTALMVHRIKAPEILMRTARKADGVQAAKAACGTVRTKGKVITFSLNGDAPAGASKRLRLFFREIGLTMKVVLLSPDGDVFEEDGDEEDAPRTEQVPEATTKKEKVKANPADPLKQKWENARAQLEPHLLTFLKEGKGDVSKARAAWSYANGCADEGDYAGALKVLTRLAALMKASTDDGGKSSGNTDTNPKADVIALIKTLKEDLARHPTDETAELDQVHKLFAAGTAAASRGDIETAFKAMMACSERLADIQKSDRAAEAKASVPEGKVAEAARAIEINIAAYRTQRLRSITGLDDLITKLRGNEDKELHAIANRVDGLRRDLPEALESALERIKTSLETGDTETATFERKLVRSLVTEAAQYLKTNEKELALCEENPFDVVLDVVAPMTEALKAVQQSLARI